MSVSRETEERIKLYESEFLKWNRRINLVSRRDEAHLHNRHLRDSIRLAECVNLPVTTWCDLGSGGGFPGIIVALWFPEVKVTLIEADTRKCAFLRHIARQLGLNATVLSSRIEEAAPQCADVLSARALAPLDRLLPLAERHGGRSTRYVFPKGRQYQAEVDDARRDWRFNLELAGGISGGDGVILKITELERARPV